MKLLLPVIALFLLASCDRHDSGEFADRKLAQANAALQAKVEQLEEELATERKSPKIPLGEEAAIRLTRLGIDPENQDPKQFHDDQTWLNLNLFHPLRKVYDQRGETDKFDEWTRPAWDEIRQRVNAPQEGGATGSN